jgi:hypothetical protein
MKIVNYSMLAILAASALAPGIAQAQKDSRLCGRVAIETPTKIGLLYEARKNDVSYDLDCDTAIHESEDKINGDAQLKTLKWKKIEHFKCEEVGNMGFINPGESPDICDNMQSKKGYKVMKNGNASATYELQ